MKTTTRNRIVFLALYAVFMVVLAVVFSLIWHHWEKAPDIFYIPWQLTGILTLILALSFVAGFPTTSPDGYKMIRRYFTGALLRGGGELAVIMIPVVVFVEMEWNKMAMALSVMVIYIASVVFYLSYVCRVMEGKKDKV